MKPPNASEQTIFDAARQFPDPQARADYLDTACAGDAPLREQIERLPRPVNAPTSSSQAILLAWANLAAKPFSCRR
jgi:hypothetical protein